MTNMLEPPWRELLSNAWHVANACRYTPVRRVRTRHALQVSVERVHVSQLDNGLLRMLVLSPTDTSWTDEASAAGVPQKF